MMIVCLVPKRKIVWKNLRKIIQKKKSSNLHTEWSTNISKFFVERHWTSIEPANQSNQPTNQPTIALKPIIIDTKSFSWSWASCSSSSSSSSTLFLFFVHSLLFCKFLFTQFTFEFHWLDVILMDGQLVHKWWDWNIDCRFAKKKTKNKKKTENFNRNSI